MEAKNNYSKKQQINNNYRKKYKLNSDNNNSYFICFESIDKNNEKKLLIRLKHNLKERDIIFYTEASLEELHNVYKFLSEFNTINSLIDYLAKLTKQDSISIIRDNKLIYNLFFFDNDKVIKFYLKRKIDLNEENIGEIEDEILNMYKNIEQLKNKLKIRDEEFEKLKIQFQRIEALKQLIKDKTIDNTIPIRYTILDDNEDIYNYKVNINKKEPLVQTNNLLKDNNNNIIFSVRPICEKKAIKINKENEKCELFTAFNLGNNHPVIVWTIKSKNNIINIQWNNNEQNELKAHNNKIDSLQYFHNENIPENNDFIISLSQNDEDTLKIWNIINERQLVIFNKLRLNTFGKIIKCFCLFNSKDYLKENIFIFIYYENFIDIDDNSKKNNEIICYKLNYQFNKINWNKNALSKTFNNSDKIKYIDTFFYKKKEILYLINCSENYVKVIENPLKDNYNGIYFNNNNEKLHFSSFIIERYNNIELYDCNAQGIYIWDINNNLSPKSIILLENIFPYDICLWNYEYLILSSSSGFYFININEKKIEITINKSENKYFSKVRKIYSPKESYSIIGIDYDYNLCLWPIKIQKNNK